MSQSILVGCLGNICRSPIRAAVLRYVAKERGVDLTVDSAGTARYRIGEDPDDRSGLLGVCKIYEWAHAMQPRVRSDARRACFREVAHYLRVPVRSAVCRRRALLPELEISPGIVLQLTPTPSGPLDESYPSVANLWAISIHVILIVIQAFIAYSGTVLIIVYMTCFLLNKGVSGEFVYSDERSLEGYERRDGEVWVFVNGVAVGKHWLKSNMNRLSETFRRRIIGVHNPTDGIIFEVIQCPIQRDFSYDTQQSYAYPKTALLDQSMHKLPAAALSKLEVYAFGCAANHFNNPARLASHVHPHGRQINGTSHPATTNGHTPARLPSLPWRTPPAPARRAPPRIVPHIEHYANGRDFVSRSAVLLRRLREPLRGARVRAARRAPAGPALPRHDVPARCRSPRARGERVHGEVDAELVVAWERPAADAIGRARLVGDRKIAAARTMRVKELSRLRLYRNGEVPEHIPASPLAS
ncbi:hypothetical protein BKA93DRAFT_828632 [Sparassis latifolia]